MGSEMCIRDSGVPIGCQSARRCVQRYKFATRCAGSHLNPGRICQIKGGARTHPSGNQGYEHGNDNFALALYANPLRSHLLAQASDATHPLMGACVFRV